MGESFEIFDSLISSIDGSEELLKFLEKTNFFTSPASTKYHCSYKGGLLDHTINVYSNLCKLNKEFNTGYSQQTLIKVAFCHDFGKIGLYEEYDKNEKIDGKWVSLRAYRTTDPASRYIAGDVSFNSYMVASRYIPFNDEEIIALCNYTHLYDPSKFPEINNIISKYPLTLLLYMADMTATYITESIHE